MTEAPPPPPHPPIHSLPLHPPLELTSPRQQGLPVRAVGNIYSRQARGAPFPPSVMGLRVANGLFRPAPSVQHQPPPHPGNDCCWSPACFRPLRTVYRHTPGNSQMWKGWNEVIDGFLLSGFLGLTLKMY